MKKIVVVGFVFCWSISLLWGQGVAINKDQTDSHPSAMLDVKATDGGVLLPRITEAQRLAVNLPAEGLLVFQTDARAGIYYFDGTNWTLLVEQNSSAPVGTIMAFAGTLATVPAGWLPCNGSAVSRTTYAELFNVTGTSWGVGDGTTTFNVPNLQGYFLRGVSGASGNDPDNATRTANNGGNTGNNVGSYQTDLFGQHLHPVSIAGVTNNTGAHTHNYLKSVLKNPPEGDDETDLLMYETDQTAQTSLAGAHNHTFTLNGNTASTGNNENRPKNGYVFFIIKF